jgi:hypothetical protein
VSRDCPKNGKTEKKAEPSKSKARAYALTREEAKKKPEMVSGTFLLNNIPASVLFDYVETFSFISATDCTLWNLIVEDIEDAFEVETADGTPVKIDKVVNECTELKEHRFPARLFVFSLGGFDVVQGMEWLAQFKASIVCNQRKVCLMTPDGSQITVYGDKEVRVPEVISMIRSEKYMTQWCQAYLAYFIEEIAKLRELGDVMVVCDFLTFFRTI